MIYRVPPEWIAQRRRMARFAPIVVVLLAAAILAFTLLPRVDWSKAQDRHAALIVTAVVVIGFGLGGIVGRFSFRQSMQRWESFEVELAPEELIRRMGGQEVRIQRSSVTSIREFPNRGFLVTDNVGWRIFVPKIVGNYADFRERILSWSKPAAPTA